MTPEEAEKVIKYIKPGDQLVLCAEQYAYLGGQQKGDTATVLNTSSNSSKPAVTIKNNINHWEGQYWLEKFNLLETTNNEYTKLKTVIRKKVHNKYDVISISGTIKTSTIRYKDIQELKDIILSLTDAYEQLEETNNDETK
jgi:hypothetical protein